MELDRSQEKLHDFMAQVEAKHKDAMSRLEMRLKDVQNSSQNVKGKETEVSAMHSNITTFLNMTH